VPYLQETLKTAPKSDKAVLLTTKAALLSGNVEAAQKALQDHDQGHFEDVDDENFREVNALWERATRAMEKAEQASKLEEQDTKRRKRHS
jgi:hypothetical protein